MINFNEQKVSTQTNTNGALFFKYLSIAQLYSKQDEDIIHVQYVQ